MKTCQVDVRVRDSFFSVWNMDETEEYSLLICPHISAAVVGVVAGVTGKTVSS